MVSWLHRLHGDNAGCHDYIMATGRPAAQAELELPPGGEWSYYSGSRVQRSPKVFSHLRFANSRDYSLVWPRNLVGGGIILAFISPKS